MEAAEIEMPKQLPNNIYDPGWLRLAASGWGAGFEAIWHSTWSVIGVTMALITDSQPAEAYRRIPYTAVLPKEEVAGVVARIHEQPDTNLLLMNVLVALGSEGGHAITVLDVDPAMGLILYQDPVNFRDPEARSLLCSENNSLGVAAKAASNRPGAWSITVEEFEIAIVAAYVKPAAFATIFDVKYKRSLQSLLDSEFGRFFNIKLIDKPRTAGKAETLEARLGAYEGEIRIQFELDAADAIQRATISVDRSMFQGPSQLLALDAIKSFIAAAMPPPDQAEADFLVEAIGRTSQGIDEGESTLDQGPPHLAAQVREVWECLIGRRQAAYYWLPLTTIAAANTAEGQKVWFQLLVALSELKGGYRFGVEEPTLPS